MKPEISSEENSALRKVLREWKAGPPLAPRFDEQVWQRIARAEETAATPWILFRNWMAQAFARPAMAVSYVTVLLLAGLIAGSWQARASSERAGATLGSRYVQMVDPYQMPRH